MFFVLCGPSFSVDELFEPLMDAASWCALCVLAVIVLARWGEARRAKSAARYSLGLNGGRP